MKRETLTDVFEKNKYNLHNASRKSRSWFEEQVGMLRRQNITSEQLMSRGSRRMMRQAIVPGNMYMFYYDAKHKDTLPYWDRFPLVLPFKVITERGAKGFLGLNLHYLPYQIRIVLLDRLMAFKNNDRLDETTRLRYSWSMIDGVSKYRDAKPCVKRYLSTHVKSAFRSVEGNDWATAMMLPVESFVGAAKQHVWAESKRISKR